jgi:uncharacterized protein YqeY
MGLKQTLEDDARRALKQSEQLTLDTLRMALSSIKNREIEKRGKGGDETLTEDEVMAVLRNEAKKRRDAAEAYRKAGREELAIKEDTERGIIERYLPKEISDEEIEKLLQPLVAGASMKDFGRVMGSAMRAVENHASGDRVSAILKQLLNSAGN